MSEIIMQALSEYGIDRVTSTRQIDNKNILEIDNRYILKSLSSNQENAEKEARLNALLYQENAPVAKIHLTKTNGYYVFVDGNYYIFLDKLRGTTVYNIYEGSSKKRVYSLGRTLAKFHLASKKIENKVKLWNNNIMDELHGWVLKEIREKQIPIMPEVIQYCIDFTDLYHSLPRQIIHRDPHSYNMSMENDEIIGIVDFGISQINSRVFDMCYAFQPNEKNFDKWLAHRSYFFSGYHEVSPISENERDGYSYMCILLELLCVAFWSTRKREDKLEENIKHVHWLYSVRNEIRPVYL